MIREWPILSCPDIPREIIKKQHLTEASVYEWVTLPNQASEKNDTSSVYRLRTRTKTLNLWLSAFLRTDSNNEPLALKFYPRLLTLSKSL